MKAWWELLGKLPLQSAGLPILMYHKLSKSGAAINEITVSWDDFRRQMDFLQENHFRFLCLAELQQIVEEKSLPEGPCVVLTFDDGDQGTLELLVPFLRQRHLKATSFLPIGHIGKTNAWDGGEEQVVGWEQLRELSGHGMEWALHSFAHDSYELMSAQMIKKDLLNCFIELESHKLNFVKALAYPFGAFHRKGQKKNEMVAVLEEMGIHLAFRIGNRKNKRPWENPLFLQRLDIQGQRPLTYFKAQLKFGKGF